MQDDLKKLSVNLPIFLQEQLDQKILNNQLLEIILDIGKKPEIRCINGPKYLSQKLISWQDLEYSVKRIGKFNSDNRAGIERTLHRISCIRNRQFLIYGLTYRIGRSIFGTVSVVKDILYYQKSILILGKPGMGKTTIIREIARVLADEMEKRVVIIDTSNEIGGDSTIPHIGIGRARRMQVTKSILQHQVMMEAVENHMPQVIIIDEISTELEVLAAQTIAEKGVQLVGTTHGNCLENLIKNPTLANLIGGIQYVILSDEESKRRRTKKTIIERKSAPTFDVIIELQYKLKWIIYENVRNSIDSLLLNKVSLIQSRLFFSNSTISIKCQRFFSINLRKFLLNKDERFFEPSLSPNTNWINLNQHLQTTNNKNYSQISTKLYIYTYSLSVNLLKDILLKLNVNFTFTNDIRQANLIIGLKKHLRLNLKLKLFSKQQKIPIYSLNKISFYQIIKLLNVAT